MKIALNLNPYYNSYPQVKLNQPQTRPDGPVLKPLTADACSFTGLFSTRENPKPLAKIAEKSYQKKGYLNGDKNEYAGKRFERNAKARRKKNEKNGSLYVQAGAIIHGIAKDAEKKAAIDLDYATADDFRKVAKDYMGKTNRKDPVFTTNQQIQMQVDKVLIEPHRGQPEYEKAVKRMLNDLITQRVLYDTADGKTEDIFTSIYSNKIRYNSNFVTEEALNDFHGFFLPMMTQYMPKFTEEVNWPPGETSYPKIRKEVYSKVRDAMIDQYKNPNDGYELYVYPYKNWTAYTLDTRGKYDGRYKHPVRNDQDLENRAYIRAFLKAAPDVPGNTVLMPNIKEHGGGGVGIEDPFLSPDLGNVQNYT